jgi:hypothetical protein
MQKRQQKYFALQITSNAEIELTNLYIFGLNSKFDKMGSKASDKIAM